MKTSCTSWVVKILLIFGFMISLIPVASVKATVQNDFINRLTPDVVEVSHQYNLYPSVMMAQAALESNFGQSSLSQNDNNYFGIKGSYDGQSVTMPTVEYNQQGQQYYVNSAFKKYPTSLDSIVDNAHLIRNGVVGNPNIYNGVWKENSDNYVDAATALGHRYATDPNYTNYLIELIQKYNLNGLLDQRSIKKFNRELKQNWGHGRPRYTKVASNNRVTLGPDYYDYRIYDHLNWGPINNWRRLGAYVGRPVYVDLIGKFKHSYSWYRIRFGKSQHHEYWTLPNAIRTADPVYHSEKYRINPQQLDLNRAYSCIPGTASLAKTVKTRLKQVSYCGNRFALLNHRVWYRLGSVWVGSNLSRPTQYLAVNQIKKLSSRYRNYRLYNHVTNSNYHERNYSWSKLKSSRNHLLVDRIAIQNRSFWSRINDHHHVFWVSSRALK